MKFDNALLSSATYQIHQGILDFIAETATDFDGHWNSNLQGSIPAPKLEVGEDFLRPLTRVFSRDSEFSILDAGCGNGVHGKILREWFPRVSYVGLDISTAALRQAKSIVPGEWAAVRADICQLPFQDATFDSVISFGVIYYADQPSRAWGELVRVLKPGGYLGVWVYPRPKGLLGFVLMAVRKICKTVGPKGTAAIADCIVPFLSLLPTRSKVHLGNSSWSECREVILVNIALDVHFPSASEVRAEAAKQSIELIESDELKPLTYWFRKI